MNLVLAITNIIGPRAFLNFVTGRYHSPVEENRFVLFVDIAGSTGLAERLGGVGIHRFLDRTFRLLTACRRGLSRRGAQLCRRRGDRDLAGTQRRGRLPSAALLHGDARRTGAGIEPIRARVRRGAADSRQPAFRAGDHRRDRRRQARHRFQRRRHEYRGKARGTQPRTSMAAFWRRARRWNGSARRRRLRFAISAGCRSAAAPTASTWSASTRRRWLDRPDPLTPAGFSVTRNPSRRLRDRPHLPVRRVARLQRDLEILQEMPREAFRLHVGEVQPEAHMRAAAERHPGEAMAVALRLFGEAHRIERIGIGPDVRPCGG